MVREADLSGLDLRGTALDGLAFDRCDLSRTRIGRTGRNDGPGGLTSFTRCDLREARLDKAEISGSLFRGCDMRGAVLAHAAAELTCFIECDLSGVEATGLRGRLSLFERCKLGVHGIDPARFPGADLARATLRGSRLDGAVLDKATLCEADLTQVRAMDSSFRGAEMQGALFTGARIRRCDLTGADLRHGASPLMRRSAARLDRAVGMEASDNTYGWEVPGEVRKRLAAEIRAALAGETGWSGAGEALRRVRAGFGEDRLDQTVGAFRRDRVANLLSGWASLGVGMGASTILGWQAVTLMQGFVSTGVAAGLVLGAASLFGSKAKDLVQGAVAAGTLALKRHAAPMVEQAVRRGTALSDLVVVAWRGQGPDGALARALAAGGIASALTGDLRVAVCDSAGFDKAMAWMRAAVASPGSLSGDVVLLRRDGGGSGPVALRFHAAGGMTAVYPDAPDGGPVSQRWEASALRASSVFLAGRPDPDPVREACTAAREAFYRGVLEDAFGSLAPDRSVRDVLVQRDERGGFSARYGYDGPDIAASDEDLSLYAEGARFGMA